MLYSVVDTKLVEKSAIARVWVNMMELVLWTSVWISSLHISNYVFVSAKRNLWMVTVEYIQIIWYK